MKVTGVGEDAEKRETLIHHLWECKFGQSLWKTVWRFLNKLKTTMWSSNSTSGIYPEAYPNEMNCDLKEVLSPPCSLQSYSLWQIWRQTSTDGGMDEGNVAPYTLECYSVFFLKKKGGNPAICNNINGPRRIVLSEINQMQKDKHCMISLIYG